MEFTLLFAALTGVAAAWLATRLFRQRLRDTQRAVDSVIGAAAVGMVAGRLAAMIQAGVNPVTNPFDILIVRGGVDPRVAAPAALAVLAWGVRPHIPGHLDALAPVALAGLAGWHAGCVWRGTCLGTASDLPWAMALPDSTVTRHPVELYAAVLLLAGTAVVARLPSRPWLATGTAVAVAGVARLATQPMRPSLTGGPVWFYAAAVVSGLIVTAAARYGRIPIPASQADQDPPS